MQGSVRGTLSNRRSYRDYFKKPTIGDLVRIIVILSIWLIASSCSAAPIKIEEPPENNMINSILNELVESTDPGIQYIVVNKDAIIFDRSIGLSDIEKGISLSSENTMAAFSMTKTLTAMAVLQLVERSEVGLDDKVSGYIEHPYNSNISIRHLLNHTSGIPNPIPLKWVHLADRHGEFEEREALFKVLNENSDSGAKPGEKIDMTLGWHIGHLNGIKYFYKEGGGAGFHSEMRISKKWLSISNNGK